MGDSRCSVPQAYPLLGTWVPGNFVPRWNRDDGASSAAYSGLCSPTCLLSLPPVQMGTSDLGCLVSGDLGASWHRL